MRRPKRGGGEKARISAIRAEAGKAGAAARWGDGPRATARLSVYPADAKRIRAIANERKTRPADIVASLMPGQPKTT